MKNEIYLNFDAVRYYSDEAPCYYFNLLVQEGCSWMVEWGDGAWNRYVGTGEWQSASHCFQDYGMQSIHIFVEDEGDILGFGSEGRYCGLLKKVNISHCPALSYFKNCHAESLDVSANPQLKELCCEHGTFDKLDLSDNPELEKLTIYFCKNLIALNLSKNLALKEMELIYSGVRRLGLHNRSVLHDVVLEDVELDERSMKYLHQVLDQNGGSIRKSWWHSMDDE